ncbi:hypothetical protein SAMN04487857_111108 [Pseudomonas sp. ok272]|uniref:hypothetical protein n=1 Tax=unclassified Pseudomonas TaxID=196821 RepID=UPI0008D17420|nr:MULTISPECIES: hypothetical protein [unclassified Pseudomonas]SEN18862.1 hypothetical protein SAMN04487857_111108 [Pseudomonas sp. ok272]SFN10865.1 hypothetical protein SAMN04487858_112108 [Pseudomonas sp. ok602]
MSKSKPDADPIEPPKLIGPPRVFRDTRYTSRTLVLPDGRTVPVLKGQVTAVGDDQFAYLNSHPDLELIPE